MNEIEAEITLTEDGATVVFEDRHGKPVKFSSPYEQRHMVIKTLRAAAAEARSNAESVSEKDLVKYYQRNAERLEKEVKRMGA
jgi:hypothetical protein